jgi:SAM-dependent methyltransferase
MHDLARTGFARVSAEYARGRPEYPPAAVRWLADRLGLAGRSALLELGAGTGKLTDALVAAGLRPVALEPVPEMRARLRERLGGVPLVGGLAERLPFRAAAFDAIVVGQAFHWFRVPAALAEMRRALRPTGGLGIVYNVRDDTLGWQRELSGLLDRYRPPTWPSQHRAWRAAFERAGRFGPLLRRSFRHEVRLAPGRLIDRVRSISFVALLDAPERAELEAAVRALGARARRAAAGGGLRMRYRTDVYLSWPAPAGSAARSHPARQRHRAQRAGLGRASPR